MFEQRRFTFGAALCYAALVFGVVKADSQQFSLSSELAKAGGYADLEETIIKIEDYGRQLDQEESNLRSLQKDGTKTQAWWDKLPDKAVDNKQNGNNGNGNGVSGNCDPSAANCSGKETNS